MAWVNKENLTRFYEKLKEKMYLKTEVDASINNLPKIYYGDGADSLTVPINADQLEGHPASYFATADSLLNQDTVVSKGTNYGEVCAWQDGNSASEDRLYRFVTLVGKNREIAIANSTSQILGTSNLKENIGFLGNYTSGIESNISKAIVSILGCSFVKTSDSTIVVNDTVVSDDLGYAVKSTNNLGYRVLRVVEGGLLEIVASPNTDTAQRIKTDVIDLQTDVSDLTESLFLPEIIVTTHEAETLTCACGSVVLTGTTVDNAYTFTIPFYGTWVIKDSTEKLTQTIEVNIVKQYEVRIGNILGIKRDKTNSSTKWERTDDSVGLSATASIGSTKGQSDFDNIDIYKGIYRYTKDTGDVVVRIPKFYYKRYYEGNVEFIKIADKQFDGFKVHPAFKKGDTEIDYFEVGAYKTTAGHFSKSGLAPLTNLTRAVFRTNAKAKGAGWGLIDIATASAIQMLILVEYADYNSQLVIGSGNCSTSAAIVTGTTDSMYNEGNHTGRASGTDTAVNCIWRGIESFWGNVWEFTDGLNVNNGTYFVCNNPQYYADDTDTNYKQLSYTVVTNLSHTFIKELGYDASESWCALPTIGEGTGSTYIPDAAWSGTGWRVCERGGRFSIGNSTGLFAISVSDSSSANSQTFGARLLYLPL